MLENCEGYSVAATQQPRTRELNSWATMERSNLIGKGAVWMVLFQHSFESRASILLLRSHPLETGGREQLA